MPQLAILKQADLFVTHAGMGGSQEGLATATPMIAVPQAADQFGNAETLTGLGVARCVPTEEATGETLRAAALALLDDPQVARRLEELRAEAAREGGTRRAADLIEAELAAARGRSSTAATAHRRTQGRAGKTSAPARQVVVTPRRPGA